MNHQFVHIGDTHLATGDRNATKRVALEQILAEGSALPRLACWLWPGDLNHARMAIDDRNFLSEYIQRLAARAPVVLLRGNHDLPGDIDIFAKLSTVHPVFVVNRPAVVDVKAATGVTVAIFALPYPERSGLVAAGVEPSEVSTAARHALDLIFMDAAAKLAEARAAGQLTLMVGHVNVGGAILSSGQPSIGQEIEIDQALLDRLGSIYKGLNHIHKPQEIAGAFYAGSICGMNFGEIERKLYLVADVEDDGGFVVTSHSLAVPSLYHVEGELTREGFRWTVQGSEVPFQGWIGADAPTLPALPIFDGAEVRVRFRFAAAEKAGLNFELVKAPFAGAKRIELDPIAEHTRALRAPEVAAAQTLTEKVEAFARGAGVTWTAKLSEKLTLLQQTEDGALFLTAIENAVTGTVPIDVEIPQEVCQ